MSSLGEDTFAMLADDEAHYRALVWASGQISWMMAPDGLATGEQRAWRAYTGQGFEESAGLGWLDAVHPDERAAVTAAWLAAVDAKALYEMVVRIRRADGVYRTFLMRGLPVLRDDGTVREWLGCCTDITTLREAQTERERLLAEAAATRDAAEQRAQVALNALLEMASLLVLPQDGQESPDGQRYESLFDTPHLGQRLADLTLLVLGCKRVALVAAARHGEVLRPLAAAGMPPEEEQRWRVGEPKDAYLRESMPPDYAQRLQDGEVLLIDFTQPPFNARPNPHQVHTLLLAPMHVEGDFIGILNADFGGEAHTYAEHELRLAGAVARMCGLVIERERLLRERGEAQASESALRAANRLMDEFLGIASHELRTPLAIFLANVQIAARRVERVRTELEQKAGEDGALTTQLVALQDLLARAEGAAMRQDRLVSDLLDVSRIQAGKLEIRPEYIDLRQVARECVEEQRLAHPQRSMLLELPEEGEPVLGDVDRIRQVIANYLTNALKYSGEAKPVRVLLRRDGSHARVEVRDEGLGLPPEERARIWERFYRSSGVERQSGFGAGLGLGLHISKTIVELHGGQVGVASVPGKGSTFWFALPLAPDADDCGAEEPGNGQGEA